MIKSSILLISIIFFLAGCNLQSNKVNEEVFIFPDKFHGIALIFFGISYGIEDSIVNNTVYYKFPKNGIIFTKGRSHNTNMIYSKYFFINSLGALKEILKANETIKDSNYRIWADNAGGNNSFKEFSSYNYLIISKSDTNMYSNIDLNMYVDSVISSFK